MLKRLLKTHKLEKLYVILASAISLIVAFASFNQSTRIENGLSLIGANPLLFTGLIALISTFSLVISSFLYFQSHKNLKLISIESETKVMTSLKLVMAFVVFIFFLDLIILGIARAYLLGSSVERYPADSAFLVKMMYLVVRYSNLIFTGIQATLFLSLMGTIIGLVLAIFLVILRTQTIDIRDHEIIHFFKK